MIPYDVIGSYLSSSFSFALECSFMVALAFFKNYTEIEHRTSRCIDLHAAARPVYCHVNRAVNLLVIWFCDVPADVERMVRFDANAAHS